MTTLNITAAQFRDLVTPVLPLVGKDESLPLLCCIKIESSGNWITATATDRYRMGVQRQECADAPKTLSALVPARAIRSILTIFKATRNANPDLVLTFADDKVTVTTEGLFGAGFELSGQMAYSLTEGDYPKIERLIVEAIAREPVATPVAFMPAQLGDFKAAQTHGEPLTITSAGPSKATLVRVGDNFIGLIQPVRFEADGADDWLPLLAVEEAPAEKEKAA